MRKKAARHRLRVAIRRFLFKKRAAEFMIE
jgi:hypothetical protein